MATFRVRYIATNGIAKTYGPQSPTFQTEDEVREVLNKAFAHDNLSAPVYFDQIVLLLPEKGMELDVTAGFEPDAAIDRTAFANAVLEWAYPTQTQ